MESQRPRGLLAQAKAQRGKTITLGVLFLMMSVIWGRTLLGDEDAKSKSKSSRGTASAQAEASTPSSSAKPRAKASASKEKKVATPTKGTIADFATAVARLESWRRPLGIEKAAPLTEEYLQQRREDAEAQRQARIARTQAARQAGAAANQDGSDILSLPEGTELGDNGPTVLTTDPAPNRGPGEFSTAPLLVDADMEVDLTLSGTLLFGEARYALFGDQRVQEGEFFGRYLLKAVRPREVDVVVDGVLTTVSITPPDLGSDN